MLGQKFLVRFLMLIQERLPVGQYVYYSRQGQTTIQSGAEIRM